DAFKREILKSVFGGEENIQYVEWTEDDWDNIRKLSEEKYQQWEWNYGRSPKFNVQHSERFPVGGIDVRLQVNKGRMEDVHIYGDFFGVGEVAQIEEALTGELYNRESIAAALESIDVEKVLGGITRDQFIHVMY
ncbi:MAG TPA: lipoate protein ligase C-terminal domain-containing protein, partial [Savagea sp.]